ncbi:MAG: hypothetical protein ABSA97_03575 [Verrucomicrobiia bacterium]|jgi:hypothetical protein
MSTTNEFLAGTDPTKSASTLRIISIAQQSNDVVIIWTTAGGRTNAVQATAGDAGGGYTTNFIDISGLIISRAVATRRLTTWISAGQPTFRPVSTVCGWCRRSSQSAGQLRPDVPTIG